MFRWVSSSCCSSAMNSLVVKSLIHISNLALRKIPINVITGSEAWGFQKAFINIDKLSDTKTVSVTLSKPFTLHTILNFPCHLNWPILYLILKCISLVKMMLNIFPCILAKNTCFKYRFDQMLISNLTTFGRTSFSVLWSLRFFCSRDVYEHDRMSMLGRKKLQKENSLEIGFWCAAVVPIKLLLNEKMVRVIKHLCLMFLSFRVQCGYQLLLKWGVGAADLFEYHVYLLELKCGNNLLPNVTFPSGELHVLIRPGGSEVFYCLPDDTSWLEKEIGKRKSVKTLRLFKIDSPLFPKMKSLKEFLAGQGCKKDFLFFLGLFQ